jgi:HK97 family phage major capsid protein
MTLAERHKAAVVAAKAQLDELSTTAAAEGRSLNSAEKALLQRSFDAASQLKAQMDRAADNGSLTAEIERLTAGMAAGAGGRSVRGGLGHEFVRSDTYAWLKKNLGNYPTGAWVAPASELMATVLDSGAASAGDLVIADYRPGIVELPQRPLRIADLLAPGSTDSNTVTHMKETSFVNAADTVREGDPKPESAITYDQVSDSVRKVAHWIPVTEEMLEDVPALRSYLDGRMRLGVELALDDQLLNGNGTAPNIEGLMNRVGLSTTVTRAGSVTNADAILDQITAIETATNMPVDGIVMHPNNWKTILQSKDGSGRYYGGGPLGAPARPMLWGRPVAVTSVIAANSALVGAFMIAAQLFLKGGLRVEASNAHSDFFVRNLIAIRAERRAALAVYRPEAFGKVLSLT